MAGNIVTFKATVDGLVIVFDREEKFEVILRQIEDKLQSAGKFFKGARLDIKYRGRELLEHEENRIKNLMGEKSGAIINSFDKDKSVGEKKEAVNPKKLNMKKLMFFDGIEEGITKFYRGTLRSGQLVDFEGNVVIIGDVNPGAEVKASGNIVIMGSLRGVVHAGRDGNRSAVITAFNLHPTQLRIADLISRPPDGNTDAGPGKAEIAYVRDGNIYIDLLGFTE